MKGFLETKISCRLSNTDLVTGTLIVIISIFLLAYAIPNYIDLGFSSSAAITPRTLPYGVAALMMLCGIKISFDGYLEQKRAAKRAAKGDKERMLSFYTVAVVMGLMGLLFSGLMDTLGYPVTNIILMCAMYYFSGGTNWKAAVILSVLFTAVAWLFFATYLKLVIPAGLWF